LASDRAALAEHLWGSIRRDEWFACVSWRALRARAVGARALAPTPLLRFYCHVDVVPSASAKRARHDRVAMHPGALEPEGNIMFGTAARYRQAAACSSLDDAHPSNLALHTAAVRPHHTPALWWAFISDRPVRAMSASARNAASCFTYFVGVRFSCAG
jgi:hypothetical protein